MLKQRTSKSQIEAFLIILFLLTLIAITPPDLKTITGKQYGSCGDGTCNIDEDKYNCPQDCEVAPETPTTPTPSYPTQPTCGLSKQYCLYQVPPKDFDSVNCKCIPFSYCADIPNYEICSVEQHCPQQNQLAYETTDGLSNKCCQKGKCEAGRLCSPSSSQGGSCRTNGYIGASCTRYVQNTEIKGICENDPTGLNYCVCRQTTTSTAPTAPECSEGDKICETALVRKFCLNKVWRTESCPYGCENGRCKTFSVPLQAAETCPSDAGPCADKNRGTGKCIINNKEGFCNSDCECEIGECSEGERKCKDRYTVLVCKDGKWDIEYCEKAERCESGECVEQKTYYSKDKESCLKYPGKYKWDEYKKVCECLPDLEAQCKTGKYYSEEIKAQIIDLHEWVPYQYGDGTDCECKCQDYAESICGLKKPGEWVFDSEKCICIPKLKTCEGQFGKICKEGESCLCGKEELLYSSTTNKESRCCLPGITLAEGEFQIKGHCGSIEPEFECDQESIDSSRLLFAAKLIEAGKNANAKSILKDISESNSPLKAKALAASSFLLAQEKNFPEALQAAKQAIQIDPDDESVIATTNQVITTLFKLMIAGIGKSSVDLSRSLAEKMGTEERLIVEKGYFKPLEKSIESLLDPDLYESENIAFEQFKTILRGAGEVIKTASGVFVSAEQYVQERYGQEFISFYQQKQFDLEIRGKTILTLSALLKEGISFDRIIKEIQKCKEKNIEACSNLDMAVKSLPQQNIKSFYQEVQSYKIQPSKILTDFLTQDKDGKLLSQYGEIPEKEFRGGASSLFRFQDPSQEETLEYGRKPTGFESILREKLENFLAKELSSDLLLLYVLPQTRLTPGGATLAQWLSHKTGVSAISAAIGSKAGLLADVLAPIGTCAILQKAGVDPEIVKLTGKLLAFFRPFSSGFQAADLYAAKTFDKHFTRGIDESIFGKDTLKYKPKVVEKFNSILNKKLNEAAKSGTPTKSAYRTAVYESLHEAESGIIGSEKLAQEVSNKLTKIAEKALRDTITEISPSKAIQTSLSSKVYCSILREPQLFPKTDPTKPAGYYSEKAAAEIVEKGRRIGTGHYGEVYEGKLQLSAEDIKQGIAEGRIKTLVTLSEKEIEKIIKEGTVIKVPSERRGASLTGEIRRLTPKAISEIESEIQSHVAIYNADPTLKIPKPLFAIEKITPEGVVYHEFVMEALKNPSTPSGYTMPLQDFYYTGIKLPENTMSQIKTELAKLHATKYVHGDFASHNVMVVMEEGKYNMYIGDFSFAKPATSSLITSESESVDILITTNVNRNLAGLPPLSEQELLQLFFAHRQ